MDFSVTKLYIANTQYEYFKIISPTSLIEVVKAVRLDNNAIVAIKIFNIDNLINHYKKYHKDIKIIESYILNQIEIEKKSLRFFKNLIYFQKKSGYLKYGFYYIVMPFISGVAFCKDHLQEDFNEKIKISITLAEKIKKLHDQDYIHLNIGPSSILINDKCTAHLHDFSNAEYIFQPKIFNRLKGVHVPPEIVNEYSQFREHAQYHYGKHTDVFAFGMILYELFYVKYFKYSENENNHNFIFKYNLFYIDALTFLSNEKTEFSYFILKMIDFFPVNRMTISDALFKLRSLTRLSLTKPFHAQPFVSQSEIVQQQKVIRPSSTGLATHRFSLFAAAVPGVVLAVGAEYLRRWLGYH